MRCKALDDLVASRERKGEERGRMEGEKRGREKGRMEGEKRGRAKEREKGIRNLVFTCRQLKAPEEYIVQTLGRQYGLSQEESRPYLAG